MLCTLIVDLYGSEDRVDMRSAIETLTSPTGQHDWSTQGVYAYWDPGSHEILYLGLTNNLSRRFSEHNGLIKTKPGSSKLQKIDAFLEERGAIGFSILLQSKAVQVWEDIEELESGIGTSASEIIAGGEGQLIESHVLTFGNRPRWNKIGGSGRGARHAIDSPSLLETLAGQRQNYFLSTRTIRDLALNLGARFKEAAIHNARMRALMEEHDLVGLPNPDDEVDVAKLEKSMLVRSGMLIDDLNVGDEVVLRWLDLFSDPSTWRAELLEQGRLGERMARAENNELGQEFLDYMGHLVQSGLQDPRLDAYSQAIREVLSTGHLDDWSRLDGVLADPP